MLLEFTEVLIFSRKDEADFPLNWSLIEGKRDFILHLFFIKEGVDNGDIIDTEIFDITEFDTIKTLYMKNVLLTKKMILKNLPKILDGTSKPALKLENQPIIQNGLLKRE